jgi:myo-inositol-1(or 4)-monophosphatase
VIEPGLIEAVRRTGAELLRRYELGEAIQSLKGEGLGAVNVVTDADIFSEAQLVAAIRQYYPLDGIEAEEGSSFSGASESVWHLDPLDGTVNFTRSIPLWGISVGRATNGVPDIGIVYLPALGLLFVGEKGLGATCNSQPLKVSSRSLGESLYCAGGFGEGRSFLYEKLALSVRATRVIESSCHELSLIARGNAEVYALRNVPHDVVAGALLVTEAGGKVTDFKGEEYTTSATDVLITNGVIHQSVLAILRGQNVRIREIKV